MQSPRSRSGISRPHACAPTSLFYDLSSPSKHTATSMTTNAPVLDKPIPFGRRPGHCARAVAAQLVSQLQSSDGVACPSAGDQKRESAGGLRCRGRTTASRSETPGHATAPANNPDIARYVESVGLPSSMSRENGSLRVPLLFDPGAGGLGIRLRPGRQGRRDGDRRRALLARIYTA
jgi:hypothetical protein